MPLNGTELLTQPWNITLSGFTGMFENVMGHGDALWMFIVVVLTFGIYIHSRGHPLYTSMFMVCAGGIMTAGGAFLSAPQVSAMFIVFTGIGLASTFVSVLFQR